ncbi:MAG: ACT domain-containing protein [Verrucomicrobiaceae bacterium]
MKQLTVLVANRIGVTAEIAACLAAHGVNIEEIDIEGVEERGIVVLTVDRYDEALRALSEQGFRVVTQDTLLIRIEDRPGALASIAMRLKDAGLDLRSMHIMHREAGETIASLVASDNAKAAEVLRDVLVAERKTPPA